MMLRTPPSKRRRWVPSNEVHVGAGDAADQMPRVLLESDMASLGQASQLVLYNGGGLSGPLLDNHFSGSYFDPSLVTEEEEQEEDVGWDSLRCSYKCRGMVKSEVLETLDLREKQVVQFEALTESLKEDINNKEAENKRIIARVNELEQLVAAKSGQEDALWRQRATELEQAEVRLRKQLIHCHKLEASLQEEIKKKAEAERKASVVETQLAAIKASYEKAAYDTARELRHLRDELQNLRQEKGFTVSRMRSEIEAEKKRGQSARAEAEAFQSQCKELENHIAKVLDERQDLEHKIADAMAKLSTKGLTDVAEAEVLVRHLRKELENSAADVAEARRMKQFHANVELLREQLESERQRANRTEAALTDHVDLELQVKSLETELEAWKGMLDELPGVQCREDIPRRMAELQREAVAALAKVGETAERLMPYQKAEIPNQNDSTDIVIAGTEVDDAKDKVMRLERQVSRLIKERDGLKAIIASYDEEEVVIARQSTAAGVPSISTPEKSKQFRIQQLEASLADAQRSMIQMEIELESSAEMVQEQRQKAESLTLDLNKAVEKIKYLEQNSDHRRKEIDMLEHELGCGEFNLAKTTILRLRKNLEIHNQGSSDLVHGLAPGNELPSSHDSGLVTNICNRSTEGDSKLASKVALLEHESRVLRN